MRLRHHRRGTSIEKRREREGGLEVEEKARRRVPVKEDSVSLFAGELIRAQGHFYAQPSLILSHPHEDYSLLWIFSYLPSVSHSEPSPQGFSTTLYAYPAKFHQHSATIYHTGLLVFNVTSYFSSRSYRFSRIPTKVHPKLIFSKIPPRSLVPYRRNKSDVFDVTLKVPIKKQKLRTIVKHNEPQITSPSLKIAIHFQLAY